MLAIGASRLFRGGMVARRPYRCHQPIEVLVKNWLQSNGRVHRAARYNTVFVWSTPRTCHGGAIPCAPTPDTRAVGVARLGPGRVVHENRVRRHPDGTRLVSQTGNRAYLQRRLHASGPQANDE